LRRKLPLRGYADYADYAQTGRPPVVQGRVMRAWLEKKLLAAKFVRKCCPHKHLRQKEALGHYAHYARDSFEGDCLRSYRLVNEHHSLASAARGLFT